jgi:Flp pilus assembly protein TadD
VTADILRRLDQAAASGSAEAVLEAGAGAIRAGLYEEAVGPALSALERHPGNAHLWHLLGLLYRNLEDLAEADSAFSKASELAPEDAMVAHGLACVRFEAGQPAAGLFERAIRLAPTERSIMLQSAAAQIAEGRIGDAIETIEGPLSRDPRWIEGHMAATRVRWLSGERDDAALSFERALRSAPANIPLWRAYVSLMLEARLFDRALEVARRAGAAAGADAAFDAAEAVALSELGQLDAASGIFRRLAPLRDVELIIHFVRLLFRMGHVREAAAIAEAQAPQDALGRFWPYASIGWRLLDDPRWQWLEGDPRFIGVYDLEECLPPLEALAQRLRALHRTSQAPIGRSVLGGTQTEGHLLRRTDPEVQALRQTIVEAVEAHVAQLPPPVPGHPLLVERRSPIRFAGSWSVRLTAGGRHAEHLHPAGWLSSALYIALPDTIGAEEDQAGWLAFGQASELGIDLPPIRTVEPKPGRLVLFPSTMWHGTRPFGAGERLTVAFDVKRP